MWFEYVFVWNLLRGIVWGNWDWWYDYLFELCWEGIGYVVCLVSVRIVMRIDWCFVCVWLVKLKFVLMLC